MLNLAAYGHTQDLINIEPDQCFTGGKVKIFGWVKPDHPAPTQVALEFTKPLSGLKITKTVTTQPDGQYSLIFDETDEVGTWKVTAYKVGTNNKGDSEFEVSNTIFLIHLSLELKNYGAKTNETYTYFNGVVANYPDFSGKDEITDSVDELLQEIQGMETLLDQLEVDVQQMNDYLEGMAAGLPDPAREALIEAANISVNTKNEASSIVDEIGEVLAESKGESEWCYLWMSYHDLCKRLEYYNNFLSTSLKDIAKNLVLAKLTQGLDQNLQKIIGKCADRILGGKPDAVSYANKTVGILAKLGAGVYGNLMTNCTNYTGDAEGKYYAELIHDDAPFFTMSYKLRGQVMLTFQKRKPGDPAVYLKGRFKGAATEFECSINMAAFALPDSIGPVWCLSATPLVADRSFILYIEGKASDNLMELELEKTGRDFKLKARAFYVILSSAAHHLPIPGTFEFPLQNAEWFFTRTTNLSNPSIDHFELPITAKGDIAIAEDGFDREIYLSETKKRVGVKVIMNLRIKICSPGCDG